MCFMRADWRTFVKDQLNRKWGARPPRAHPTAPSPLASLRADPNHCLRRRTESGARARRTAAGAAALPTHENGLLPFERSTPLSEILFSEIHARICSADFFGAVPSTLWSARQIILPPR